MHYKAGIYYGILLMNKSLTIYINPVTVNSIKVILLCNALNIKPDYKFIKLNRGEHRASSFLEINPDGKVPVLVEGDYVLNESNAILQYLAHKHASSLWPEESKQQAEVLKWLFWQGNDWNKIVGSFTHRHVVLPYWGMKNKEPLTEKILEGFHLLISRLDCALNDKSFLVGNKFTIADISLASYLILSDKSIMPIADYVHVNRWLKTLSKMPCWQESRHLLLETLSVKL